MSIFRPAEQRFYVINELGSRDGGLGAADFSFIFGNPGDKPFVGDFNDDGIDTIGLHRESTGLVYFRNSNSTGIADNQFIYGDPGDKIVAGDWDGDGDDSIGVYRPLQRDLLPSQLQQPRERRRLGFRWVVHRSGGAEQMRRLLLVLLVAVTAVPAIPAPPAEAQMGPERGLPDGVPGTG